MKRTTLRIVEKFPHLERIIALKENGMLDKKHFQSLPLVDQTFLRLACFFENPETENFNLTLLYKGLDNDWLEWALELIALYFREDTYLIQNPSISIIREGSEYYNQSHFAEYLNACGLNYTRQKVKNYYSRGKIPNADLVIDGTAYWSQSTVEKFGEQERKRLKIK
ncbi:hypothetical protein [Mesobacillus foraminis]|uniref:hypothetical protein n=1 Tax=Mesobacillus foraminis TaxID=279826 RepID=UPI000EF553E4|nr:hypothetical protein [Mesobacillus foraminis]